MEKKQSRQWDEFIILTHLTSSISLLRIPYPDLPSLTLLPPVSNIRKSNGIITEDFFKRFFWLLNRATATLQCQAACIVKSPSRWVLEKNKKEAKEEAWDISRSLYENTSRIRMFLLKSLTSDHSQSQETRFCQLKSAKRAAYLFPLNFL